MSSILVWLIICVIINVTRCIDVQNTNSVSKWWYQCLVHDPNTPQDYTITTLEIRSYQTLAYISCIWQNWPPYPWVCESTDIGYVLPLTARFTNSLGQEVIIEDLILSFVGNTRFNSTHTFVTATTTMSPTPLPNTNPTSSPLTLSPTVPTPSPTNTPIVPTTTTQLPDTPFLGSSLQFPYFVGYINKVLCDTGDDLTCLASIGLPGYSTGASHAYNVLYFGAYIISNNTGTNALQFWFHPRQYLTADTIRALTGSETASETEIRMVLHNMYARYDIKILLSTFGAQDNDILSETVTDDWIGMSSSPYTIAQTLAHIVRNYWFDGININFEPSQSAYFDAVSTGEIDLIILTESINSALNRNSLNPYFIITHTASAEFFEKSVTFPNGGLLMLHQYCSHLIKWYNIDYFGVSSVTYNTFETLFTAHNTSMDHLLRGSNKLNVAFNSVQIVIAKSMSSVTALTFANIISEAVTREYPQWDTGFMVYDFLSDAQNNFEYTLTLIPAFTPTHAPTEVMPEPTPAPIATYPTVRRYSETDNSFDLLNLNSYGWGEWFFLVTMLIVLCFICVCVGCCYHRYKVRDRILTDDQIQDMEDDMNKTAISDSWRRLSKLLVRTDSTDMTQKPMAWNAAQAQRSIGQSIYTNEQQENIELTGLDKEPQTEDIQQIVGQSLAETNVMPIEDDEEYPQMNPDLEHNVTVTND